MDTIYKQICSVSLPRKYTMDTIFKAICIYWFYYSDGFIIIRNNLLSYGIERVILQFHILFNVRKK